MKDQFYVELTHRNGDSYNVRLFDADTGEAIASADYSNGAVMSCIYLRESLSADDRDAMLTLTREFDGKANKAFRALRSEYRQDHGASEHCVIFSASYETEDDLAEVFFPATTA